MNMSEPSTDDGSESDDSQSSVTVSVSSSGQATIPKQIRDKLGINAPGQVLFREIEDGEIVIKPVPSAAEMEGFARSADPSTDKPASELLRQKREADQAERDTE